MEPRFLDLEKVLTLHQRAIERYGGAHGLRDRGALESALMQAQASFGGEYLHKDLFEMAAAYLYHIAQNHPFLDGNKRTGAAAAVTFLALNKLRLDPEANDALEALVWNVAKGEADKTSIARFFREHVL